MNSYPLTYLLTKEQSKLQSNVLVSSITTKMQEHEFQKLFSFFSTDSFVYRKLNV
jgi:hypothetical protein